VEFDFLLLSVSDVSRERESTSTSFNSRVFKVIKGISQGFYVEMYSICAVRKLSGQYSTINQVSTDRRHSAFTDVVY
jgi:hypothetical protein